MATKEELMKEASSLEIHLSDEMVRAISVDALAIIVDQEKKKRAEEALASHHV